MKAFLLVVTISLLNLSELSAQSAISGDGIHSLGGFGTALALDGDMLITSRTGINPSASSPPTELGSVFIYQKDGDDWTEIQRIRPDSLTLSDGFGHTIAASDQVLAISAPFANEECGLVYTYLKADNGAWEESDVLDIPGCDAPAHMGYSLDVYKNGLVIGAPKFQDHGAVGFALYQKEEWDLSPLSRKTLVENSRFGHAVKLTPRGILVGSPTDSTGAIHYFKNVADNIREEQYMRSPFGEGSSHFGATIDWVDNQALVSAPGMDPSQGRRGTRNPGMVQILNYDSSTSQWSTGKVVKHKTHSIPGFGSSVLLNGRHIWVGSPNANESRGMVHTFQMDRTIEEFMPVASIRSNDASSRSGFGLSMATNGETAYVSAMHDDFGEGKVYIFDLDEYSGRWNQVNDVHDEGRELTAVTGDEIKCQDGTAHGFDCSNVDILSFLPAKDVGAKRGMALNDVWGWTDPDTGAEIAIIARNDGTSFIDVSDANNPVYLGDLPMTPGSRPNYWRDVKTYQNHAFIVADNVGKHGMQIIDLTQFRDLTNTPVELQPDAVYDSVYSAHNVIINEDSGFAYVVGMSDGGETCGGALHMVDIREPKNPKFAGCYHDVSHPSAGRGAVHDAQCVNYTGPDEEHRGKEICFSSNEKLMLIVDVSDKSSPTTLAAVDYPSVAYTHQGWLTEDQDYFYLNDEGDESANPDMEGTRTMVYDVSDLDDPILKTEFFGTSKVIDHNLYIKGDYMYQSNYIGGLRIIDIADRENPVEVGYFDTVPWNANVPGFGGSWSNYPFFKSGTIIVSSQLEGVFMLRQKKVEL